MLNNHLMVTKDINKKNKIKQEIIDKNKNDSFVIFDENDNWKKIIIVLLFLFLMILITLIFIIQE